MRSKTRTASLTPSAATKTASIMLGLLTMICAVLYLFTQTVNAQSSVRPPANATTNAVPGDNNGPTAGRDPVAPLNLKNGNVPGGSLGTNSQADIWRKIRELSLIHI